MRLFVILSRNHQVSRFAMASALALCFTSQPAFAEGEELAQDGAQAEQPQDIEDDLHDRRVDYQGNIVVSATGLHQLDVLAGTSVLEGGELQRNLAGQIGEVLVKLPGVSATGFTPGASRPVLRGFSGERVRVLVDGLSTSDVSNTSVDHATTIDPLTSERIEVLRGPAVLLYGSQAIGGAVNVVDKRIPRRVPDEPVHVDGMASWDSAFDLAEFGASVDVPLGQRFVVHASGSWRDTNDMEIPGYAVAPELRADLLADADEEEEEGHLELADELREGANQRGVLPNTATRTWSANAGFAFIDGDNSLGFSLGWYDTNYGVPIRPGAGHHEGEGEAEGEEGHGEGLVSIGLEQLRADMRAELGLGDGAFSKLIARLGYSDYTHTEFEGDEVGTTFDSESLEARVELAQKDTGSWRGSIGSQYFHRDFYAEGAEAYVAPNTTDQFALFTLQEFGSGPVQLEAAGRFETTKVESQPLGIARSFDAISGALGVVFEPQYGLRTGINLSHAERAPSAEELFSDGPHIATQAYEMGDPGLGTESAIGLEGFVRGEIGAATVSFAVFKNWFSDYIYLSETGLKEDDLPVFEYLQSDADYFGVEGSVSFPLVDADSYRLLADLRGEYVRAKLDDGSAIPRIPPLSLLGALEAQTDAFDARAEVEWFARQDKVAEFETPTDSFALVNLSLSWRPLQGQENVTLVLAADNVFDVTGRRHASFTKDFVPLVGRNLKASLRFSF
ncbi:TonB-dependent receptor [Altererythrobacter sp. Z27]|uniref:TonB-dependent receptor n=1 Tax=Altererythrobacter sp. Z27 TaxID=3461147 RepID=UPI0040445038